MSRMSETITFSLPREIKAQVRRVLKEDDLSVSELLWQGIRLFMEEWDWHRRERLERLRSRQATEQGETGRGTDG